MQRTCAFRLAAFVHNLAAVLAVVGGVLLLVHTLRGSASLEADDALESASITRRPRLLHLTEAGALLAFGVASLLAARRRSIGVVFRVLYLLVAVAIAAAMLYRLVTSLRHLAHSTSGSDTGGAGASPGHGGGAANRTAWEELYAHIAPEKNASDSAAFAKATSAVCRLELAEHCRGLDDGDCAGCQSGRFPATCKVPKHCADCKQFPDFAAATLPPPDVGCYAKAVDEGRSGARTHAVIAGTLLLVVVLDVALSCCFPVHVAELILDEAPVEMEVTA